VKKRQPVTSVKDGKAATRSSCHPTTETSQGLSGKLDDASLLSMEEKVIRMRYGVSIDEARPLGQKTDDPALLEQLAEIELLAYCHLTEAPNDSPRSRILSRLQRR